MAADRVRDPKSSRCRSKPLPVSTTKTEDTGPHKRARSTSMIPAKVCSWLPRRFHKVGGGVGMMTSSNHRYSVRKVFTCPRYLLHETSRMCANNVSPSVHGHCSSKHHSSGMHEGIPKSALSKALLLIQCNVTSIVLPSSW